MAGRWQALRPWFNGGLLLLGLGALAYMFFEFGVERVGATILAAWGSMLGAVAFLALGVVLGAVVWQHLLPPRIRPPLRALLPAHMAGYGLNRLLPTGNAGEVVKVAMLEGTLPVSESSASLVVATVFGSLAGQLMAALAALVALVVLPFPTWVGVLMLALALGFALVTAGSLLLLRAGLIQRLRRRAERWSRGAGLARLLGKTERFEAALDEMSRLPVREALLVGALLLLVRVTHVLAAFVVVAGVLPQQSLGDCLLIAFVLTASAQLVRWVFAIIPSGLGAVEGSSAFLLHALGLSEAMGLSIALVQRIAGLVLPALCLLFLLGSRQRTRRAPPRGEPVSGIDGGQG